MGDVYHADTLTLFAAAAAQTERIRLGTSIVSTYPRHPLVMARQALALHGVAPGRLRLGVGPGGRIAIEDWYGLSLTSPLPYLKDYVETLRAILWEGSTNYQGTFFKVTLPTPRTAQVPLLISALGPKAFQLAGEIADGALPWMSPIPYLLKIALPALRAGAEARQRPAPPVIAHILVALSTNEAAVLAAARQWAQMYARVAAYARMFAQAGFAGAVDGNEAELDALARTLVISGDEATVRSRVQELLASGLDELQLQLVPIADETQERQQLLQLVGSL
jgi:alkanesulfonate monooxygenase SsuD/methylene tetrahydromethanopterin reductase-like flavin-dependent oxidoreductase (luciferase family)